MKNEVVRAVELLAMEAVDGVGVTDLSRRLGVTKAKAYRTLQDLLEGGWCEQTKTERYVLSRPFGELAERIRKSYLAQADAISQRLERMNEVPAPVKPKVQ